MNWDYMGNGWMGGWMWIPFVLILALLAFGIVAVIRAQTTGAPDRAQAPLAIAARRLAAGEITTDEYEELRATISGVSR